MKQVVYRDLERPFINVLKLLKKHEPKEERHGRNISKQIETLKMENKISEIKFSLNALKTNTSEEKISKLETLYQKLFKISRREIINKNKV